MDLQDLLETQLKEAMKSGDETRKRTIRLILASVKLVQVEKGGRLDDQAILNVIQKEIKIRREAIEGARQADRNDLIQKTELEIDILQDYLPKQLTADEIIEITKEIIAEIGAKDPSDTGKVMKALMPKLQGRATGDIVSRIVRDQLTDL